MRAVLSRCTFLALWCIALPAPAGEAPARQGFAPPSGLGIPADYRSRWPQLAPLSFSGMHWNQSVTVFSNAGQAPYRHNQDLWWEQEQNSGWSGADSGGAFQSYAPGTVLVKEGFMRAKPGATLHPTFLSIMVKREKGFDPEYGDWEYIQSSPQGKVLLRGAFSAPGISTACGNCHTNVADRDYVFSTTGKGG
jgi:hypothetical protein